MSYAAFLVLSLAVAGVGLLLQRRSVGWSRFFLLLGGLGCAVCIAWQVRQTLFSPTSKGPDRGQAVVAYYLAQQVLAELGDRQGPVALLFPPESVFDEETVGTYAGTFNRVLRGSSNLKVEVIRMAARGKAAKAGAIPLAAFQQAMSNSPSAVAYVSFGGVPQDFGSLLPTTPGQGPAFFVFDPWGSTNWLAALRRGQVRTVIVPRPRVDTAVRGEIVGEPNEVFNRLYFMATPRTADQTAAQIGSK